MNASKITKSYIVKAYKEIDLEPIAGEIFTNRDGKWCGCAIGAILCKEAKWTPNPDWTIDSVCSGLGLDYNQVMAIEDGFDSGFVDNPFNPVVARGKIQSRLTRLKLASYDAGVELREGGTKP